MTSAKRATIRDVAAAAGVSKSLVSLVFSSPEGVSEERRKRVLAAAKKLGYTPNPWARSLRSGTGTLVGIIVADLHNPLFTEVADMVRQSLGNQGIYCVVAAAAFDEHNGSKKLDPTLVQNLFDLKLRGLLVVGGLPDYKPLTKAKIPVVVALTGAGDLPLAVSIRGDDHEAMRVLLDHLTSLGHSRIGYIGPNDTYVATYRREAFISAAVARNLSAGVGTYECERSEEGGYKSAQEALSSPLMPTALVCYNDNVAFGVQDAVDQHSEKGGNPVAVTGYDNTYISQLGKVSLTTIEQDKELVAARACEILLDNELYKKFEGSEILTLPRLYIRKSTALVISKQ